MSLFDDQFPCDFQYVLGLTRYEFIISRCIFPQYARYLNYYCSTYTQYTINLNMTAVFLNNAIG
ncbi:MAG: hypothetical protein ETSY1_21180 [Candidatus Entotheonella factor]|uniref:Uncharacterized protein n=1 Tax=Entotheonella factor TaxID=1429438 RepID=W4LIP9_ENTF1|nr:MAG: hypothetical protein ETSY1_21180 [Candidatus Entotheonella factor]